MIFFKERYTSILKGRVLLSAAGEGIQIIRNHFGSVTKRNCNHRAAACGEASMKVRGKLKLRSVLMSSSRPTSSIDRDNNVVLKEIK